MATYDVTVSSFNRISKEIERIAKKCDKRGLSYTYSVSEPHEKTYSIEDSKNSKIVRHYTVSVVTIDIEMHFKYEGWVVKGCVSRKDGIEQMHFDHRDENSASFYKQFRHNDYHCDHCHQNRNRNHVVIIQHDNGELKQVGSTCLDDFCGIDGEIIVRWNEAMGEIAYADAVLNGEIEDFDREGFFGTVGTPCYSVEEILQYAAATIRVYGFVKSGYEDSTSAIVKEFFGTAHVKRPELTESDKQDAEWAIKWLRSEVTQEEIDNSNYLYNLQQIVNAGYASFRHFGILVSLIPTFKRAMEKKIQDSIVEREKRAGTFLGEVGQKLSADVTITKVTSYDSMYGTGYIYSMMDKSGNTLVWFASRGQGYSEGNTVKITGTVKEHKEYHGVNQTILTRCKITSNANTESREMQMSSALNSPEVLEALTL